MKKIVLLLIIILVLFSCKKRELKIYKLDIISESIETTRTSATVTVSFSYPTKLDWVDGIISNSSDMSNANIAQATFNKNTFVINFQSLEVNTHYYYIYEFSNGIDVIKTDKREFTTDNYGFPIVETAEITNITTTSATCGGILSDDGGTPITSSGVCWSTSQNPTINDYHTTDNGEFGLFTSNIIDLTNSEKYYVRAYATNIIGTTYGAQKAFFTGGVIPGLFSVGDSCCVYFSMGNLQYNVSDDKWKFADNQWDFIGENNSFISNNYDGWIDLFGWGTGNNPSNTSTNNMDYIIYNEWGNNNIMNGGDNDWRTLTNVEWSYIFNHRNTISGIRYAKAIVNGYNGVIILPDTWDDSINSINEANNSTTSFNKNNINILDWINNYEKNGAVFLPASGYRSGISLYKIYSAGYYWSSTVDLNYYASDVVFNDSIMRPDNWYYKYYGQSVRLVHDYQQ